MIQSKIFDTVEELNDFIREKDFTPISIYEVNAKVDTGLPLPRGGTFITDKIRIKLWYNTKEKSF